MEGNKLNETKATTTKIIIVVKTVIVDRNMSSNSVIGSSEKRTGLLITYTTIEGLDGPTHPHSPVHAFIG